MKLTEMKPSEVPYHVWLSAYRLWVTGDPDTKERLSLAKVGERIGVRSGASVSYYFQKLFGVDATNPKHVSFIRSLRDDYPDDKWVTSLDPVEHGTDRVFTSLAGERSRSRQKGVGVDRPCRSVEMTYKLAYQNRLKTSYDPWEQFEQELRLPYLYVILTYIVSVLGGVYENELHRDAS